MQNSYKTLPGEIVVRIGIYRCKDGLNLQVIATPQPGQRDFRPYNYQESYGQAPPTDNQDPFIDVSLYICSAIPGYDHFPHFRQIQSKKTRFTPPAMRMSRISQCPTIILQPLSVSIAFLQCAF